MGQLKVKPISITQFVGRLETETGFCFARYGDGTFLSLRGSTGVNCDGAKINGDQAELIEKSIRDSSITHGIGDLALSNTKAADWLEEKGIDIEWYDCNVLHLASIRGELYPFIEILQKRRNILIGPKHLSRFRGFPYYKIIFAHPTEAFYQVDQLETVAERAVDKHQANMVLISAGTAAPVLVSRLHRSHPEINVLDVGSLWDPYVGRLSRKVFRQLGHGRIEKLGRVNFRQEIRKWWATT